MCTSRLTFALALLASLTWVGCASTQTSAEAEEPTATAEEPNPNRVEGDDLDRRALDNIEEMLRGQVAGVTVRYTGRGLVIRIRGTNTFLGTQDPLFIVDGLPIELGADGALVGLNPRDVATIEVLKNVADTAFYGVRGANGVVLITTRRPPPPQDEHDGSHDGRT
ncbi:MAG: TonB-dependent receptor plug domain-containing protein [Bacteroidota bacterium]